MRPLNKLTLSAIKNAGHGRHGDGGGLWLEVDSYGGRWVFRYQLAKRSREMGLGSLRDVGLSRARQMAQEARELLARRIDPIARRQASQASVPTFADVAEDYITAQAAGFRNAKHIYQWRQTLGDSYCKALRSRRVDEITTDDVMGVIRPIWTSKAETAQRLRARIERILDAARIRGYRTGENPARWKGHLEFLLPKRAKLQRGHHAALPADEVPGLIELLRAKDTVAAYCLEFTILTASRTGEAIAARWEEVDGDVWTVPAARMKAFKAHRVPLVPRAIEIIDHMRKLGSPWVFPGQHRLKRHLSNMAMLRLLDDLGFECTTHGFRSTFRDWAGDRTNFPREIIEAALAHSLKSEVEAAYRRSDALEKRRRLMEAWAGFCEPKSKGNVLRPAFGKR